MLAPKTPLARFWVSATGSDSGLRGFDSLDAADLYALRLSRQLPASYVSVSDRTDRYRVVCEFRDGSSTGAR